MHQESGRVAAPSRVIGVPFGAAPKCRSPPTPGSNHGDFLSFLLTSWPQAASLRSRAFLHPYTCHLFLTRLIGLPPSSLFPALPILPWHVASIKVKNQTWKNTMHYIQVSVPGYFVFLVLARLMGWTTAWGPHVPKWNNTSFRRKLDLFPPHPKKQGCLSEWISHKE